LVPGTLALAVSSLPAVVVHLGWTGVETCAWQTLGYWLLLLYQLDFIPSLSFFIPFAFIFIPFFIPSQVRDTPDSPLNYVVLFLFSDSWRTNVLYTAC
jgi:hypothetical protein